MSESRQFFTKYRFPLFFFISYLLSWSFLVVSRLGLLPHGPALAAWIVIALSAGRPGLRQWWSRLTNFRGGWWYLAGPAILVAGLAIAAAANVLLGAPISGRPDLSLATVGLLLLLGGQWEELGWSGFALPALQERFANVAHGALIATLILGLFRGIWHIPLVIVGAVPWYEAILVNLLVYQPLVSWLYNKSGGSVPVVWVFHYLSNLLVAIAIPLFAGAAGVQYMLWYFVFGFVVALVIALRTRFEFGWQGAEE